MKDFIDPNFLQAEKIWIQNALSGQFLQKEISLDDGEYSIIIGCESDYAVYLGDRLLYAGAYYAPRGYLSCDRIDFAVKAPSVLTIIAAYYGEGSSVYRAGEPCFIYELTAKGRVVACSKAGDELFISPTVRRAEYNITAQLGRSFEFFPRAACTDKRIACPSNNTDEPIMRPVKQCTYTKVGGFLKSQGAFLLSGGTNPAELIYNAYMRPKSLVELSGVNKWGVDSPFNVKVPENAYLLIDLGCERTGQIYFEIDSEEDQSVLIGYGEHLESLRPATFINYRNFAFSYFVKKGETNFVQPFGRMGGRYLIAFFEKPCLVKEVGIYDYMYPVDLLDLKLSDSLPQRIYDVAVRTNHLCMHTHYEDCPWREQAFYGMDARNQMLYGYYIFGEGAFAKHSLRLFYSTQREDGLFDLCAPSQIGTTIPSFSLFLLMALAEYYDFAKDKDFVLECAPIVDRCIARFLRDKRDGLIPRLYEKQYWNFYEWSEGLDGGDIFRDKDQLPIIDLPINAILVMALRKIDALYKRVGLPTSYGDVAEEIFLSLENKFYNEQKGAFASFLYEGRLSDYNELNQVLMLWIGSSHSAALADLIIKNVYPSVTVAFLGIKYDALLSHEKGLITCVLGDIEQIFGKMLDEGATSFYETAKGAADFEGAGSLCHAWASIPAYIYRKYLTGVDYEADTVTKQLPQTKLKVCQADYIFNGQKRKLI